MNTTEPTDEQFKARAAMISTIRDEEEMKCKPLLEAAQKKKNIEAAEAAGYFKEKGDLYDFMRTCDIDPPLFDLLVERSKQIAV